MINLATYCYEYLQQVWHQCLLDLYKTDEIFADSVPEDIIFKDIIFNDEYAQLNDKKKHKSEYIQEYLDKVANDSYVHCKIINKDLNKKHTKDDTELYQYELSLPKVCFQVLKKYNLTFPWVNHQELGHHFLTYYEKYLSTSSTDININKMIISESGMIYIQLSLNYMLQNLYNLAENSYQLQTNIPETIVVDFSSPNMAKEMHLGHIRSTIIGDVISRFWEFKGHRVKRINHLGDWGRPFAIVIAYLQEHLDEFKANPTAKQLQKFYIEGTKLFTTNTDFEKKVYDTVGKLQNKDSCIYNHWKNICFISRKAYQQIYDSFNIEIEDMGESTYQDKMEDMITTLRQQNKLREIDGMSVIKIDGISNPFILKKSMGKGGNYTYDTSDLAALKYRLDVMKADRIYYVVDAGQSNHFVLLFETGQQVGYYNNDDKIIKHIKFGLVQSSQGNKLSARKDNDNKQESTLLQEIIDKGYQIALERTRKNNKERAVKINLTEKEIAHVASELNYNCLKYFELSHKRTNNYKIDHTRLFSEKGNTAIYANYSYARLFQIITKFQSNYPNIHIEQLIQTSQYEIERYIPEPSELKLLVHLLQFPEMIQLMEFGNNLDTMLMPHYITDYLYKLSTLISKFYGSPNCYCLDISNPDNITVMFYNRILVIMMALKIMKTIFNLLGIQSLDKI
jgi:arginyl-tRNA synthetase